MAAHHTLVVVDMQNDFIDGALGTKEAVSIVPAVEEKIKSFQGEVIFTRDTHEENYLKTAEGKKLPVKHCIRGTKGWEICDVLKPYAERDEVSILDKPGFASLALMEMLKKEYEKGMLLSVELVGLCTDICVVSNALLLKAYMPELPIFVDSSCCAGVTKELHEAALATMGSCQIMVR